MVRARIPALLALLLLLPGTGCATTVGTVAGPVTTPISFVRNTWGPPTWLKVVLAPFAIPIGPFIGFREGARADIGYLRNGEYGVYPGPPFEIVWDPANARFGGPGMDNSYGDDQHHADYVKWGSLADRRTEDLGSGETAR
jgi:hypothetical protein